MRRQRFQRLKVGAKFLHISEQTIVASFTARQFCCDLSTDYEFRRRIILTVGVVGTLGLAACSDPHKYPPTVADNFISSCTTDQQLSKQICSCIFEKIQKKYTFSEFKEIDKKAEANNFSQDFIDFADNARTECSK